MGVLKNRSLDGLQDLGARVIAVDVAGTFQHNLLQPDQVFSRRERDENPFWGIYKGPTH
jgi:hypothetical protein